VARARIRLAALSLCAAGVFAAIAGYGAPIASEPLPAAAADRTAELDLLRDADGQLDANRVGTAFAVVKPQLANLRFVLVPGYLTDFLKPLDALGLSDYLQAQEAALRDAGFSVERAEINTLESAATNAALLKDLVESSDRRICLITHSKGGVDALVFLLTASDEARRRVACWVAFQAPFRGSTIADDVSNNEVLQLASHGLLGFLGGSTESLEDLSSRVRLAFLETHREELAEVVRNLPLVVLSASVEPEVTTCIRLRPIYSTLSWMSAQDLLSDGLVPSVAQTLPGAPYVALSGIDHTGAVADSSCAALSFEQRKLLTQALLSLALRPWST